MNTGESRLLLTLGFMSRYTHCRFILVFFFLFSIYPTPLFASYVVFVIPKLAIGFRTVK